MFEGSLVKLTDIAFSFGSAVILLFLIIICLIAYQYLRAQVQHVAEESESIFGLRAEKEKLEKEIKVGQEHLTALKGSLDESEFDRIRKDKVSLEQEYDSKFRELEDAKDQLNSIGLELDKNTVRNEGLKRELSEIEEELSRLKKEREEVRVDAEQITQTVRIKEEVDEELKALESLLEAKKDELNRLLGDLVSKGRDLDLLRAREQDVLSLVDKKEEVPEEVSSEVTSLFDVPSKFELLGKRSSMSESEDERSQLDAFQNALRDVGCFFTDRTLRSFHTSLKCNDISPLTVLAGVSGTGKTLLPLKYSEFFGIPNLVVPVQPRWDSHDDLFGSYNYFEQRFVATEMARSLVLFDRHNNVQQRKANRDWSNHLFLVLLDEMNLARTEYYFSEFLSRLELRRDVDETKPEQRAKAELLTGKDARVKMWIGTNVFFVGTMNEDESTQSLSDKVLDRANVLRFTAPSFSKIKSDVDYKGDRTIGNGELMPHSLWKKWVSNGNINYIPSSIDTGLNEIADIMASLGRPFGHRLMDSMRTYIGRYPIQEERGAITAFGDQIEQRLLPKLRGLQLSDDSRQAMGRLMNVVEKIGDGELADGIRRCLDTSDLDLFFWTGISREAA